MEFTVAWFWVIKVFITIVTLGTLYLSYRRFKKTKKVFNFYTFLFFGFIILQFISPIKIDFSNSKEQTRYQNTLIEMSKKLPKKIKDTSFKDGEKQVQSITEKEIWK